MSNMYDIDPSELSEMYRIAWEEWSKKNGEAMSAKKIMDVIHSEIMKNCGDIPANKAKIIADTSVEYKKAINDWIKAETDANILRGKREAIETKIDLIRSLAASERERLKRLGA